MATNRPGSRSVGWLRPLVVALLLLFGLANLGLGIWLLALGGSAYYAIVGVAMAATAVLLWRRAPQALSLYALIVVGTLVWALIEVGFDWWKLVPRGDIVFGLGAVLLLPWITRQLTGYDGRAPRWAASAAPLAGALIVAAMVALIAAATPSGDTPGSLPTARIGTIAPTQAALDWRAYAHDWTGNKYSRAASVTPANIDRLKVAWSLRTGDRMRAGDPSETTYEMTPLEIGGTVYLCTPHDWVIAVDAETGRERWRFDPHIQVSKGLQHLTCRGVSYHDATDGGRLAATGPCPQRLLLATNDGRLVALDPKTGAPCPGFGTNGAVGLWTGMPVLHPGWYQGTSAPLIVRDLVVVGGAVYDDKAVRMPSGVIRAYDVATGRLMWNFDPGKPGDTRPIAPGQTYSVSSPNMWSTAAADEQLGLIYLPMGMGAIDQWGGQRPPTTEYFATSVLALDAATGRPRWRFQTVHHDLWDMDVPAQPSLVDLDLPGRGRVPALIQSTKTGNLFVLDRRTGQPLLPVTERPVPGGAAPGDHTAPTQPVSALSLMPRHPIRERDMWGATMFDQLGCRIAFRRLRYDGPFTPPSLQGTLVFPGNFGVMDWGGIAVDPVRQVAFAHPNYIAFVDRLIPRRDPGANGDGGSSGGSDFHGSRVKGYSPNHGAPFAVAMNPFLSAIGLPCQAPPWGYVAGLDLRTGRLAWQHRNGTVRDETPLPLPFKMGVPSLGGPLVTAGGVAFMSSAIDDYVRGYDMTTGKVLWRARLPAGGQASPMTYVAPSGRQFVVVVAGGHSSLGTKLGDSVIAYAL